MDAHRRHSRSLALAGPLLYNGQISRLKDRIEELEGGPRGPLTVAGSSTILPITQEIPNEFMAKYRGIEISVAGRGLGTRHKGRRLG